LVEKMNINQKLYICGALLLFSIPSGAATNKHEISIVNCPSKLTFEIPTDFSPPRTPDQLLLEKAFIGKLHANKASKVRYSQIFMREWQYDKIDKINFASLGSLLEHQGRISNKSWRELRDSSFDFNKEPYRSLMQEKQQANVDGAPTLTKLIKTGKVTSFVAAHNKAVEIQPIEIVTNNKRKKAIVAAIFFYAKSCIAIAYLAVKDEGPESMDRLFSYVSEFNLAK